MRRRDPDEAARQAGVTLCVALQGTMRVEPSGIKQGSDLNFKKRSLWLRRGGEVNHF